MFGTVPAVAEVLSVRVQSLIFLALCPLVISLCPMLFYVISEAILTTYFTLQGATKFAGSFTRTIQKSLLIIQLFLFPPAPNYFPKCPSCSVFSYFHV